MLLVLALRSDADRVYAEGARSTSRRTNSPRRSRRRGASRARPSCASIMKQDGRDLLAQFRELPPARRPIAIQRWSFRRVALILTTIAPGLPGCVDRDRPVLPDTRDRDGAGLRHRHADELMAQSVPTATQLPCARTCRSAGASGTRRRSGAGRRSWSAWATGRHGGGSDPHRDVPAHGGGHPADADRRRVRGLRADGPATRKSPSFSVGGGLTFTSRADVVNQVASEDDQVLCGALAPPCP